MNERGDVVVTPGETADDVLITFGAGTDHSTFPNGSHKSCDCCDQVYPLEAGNR